MPRAIVIRAAGTNCDEELLRALTLAGATADRVHLDRLCASPASLERYDIIAFPGGFSFGDDVASGRVFAMKVREKLYPALREAVLRGGLIIGICNGFQVLVQVGLLPGPAPGEPWPHEQPPAQSIALTDNQNARFCGRWVPVRFEASSVCAWTRGLDGAMPREQREQVSMLPVAHGEGRLVASPQMVAALEQSGQVALRYLDNYNGSAGSIAGVCDATGRVFGLMPHPERYLDWNRHPFWTRLDPGVRTGDTPGLALFKNAVAALQMSGVA